MQFGSLVKPYADVEVSNSDFAAAIGIHYWLEETQPNSTHWLVHISGEETRPATTLERSLWFELRHAYGFKIPRYAQHLQ